MTLARCAAVAAVALGALAVGAAAQALAAPSSAGHAVPAVRSDDPPADEGAGDGLVTFGMTTASGGRPDERGFIAVNAPPGAELYDNVAVVNFSDAPLDVDLYPADATNAEDGGLALAPRSQPPALAATWVTVGSRTVRLPAQAGATGPGVVNVPITISIPRDAEPGDHVAAVVSSITASGTGGENTPALDLEQRVGLRVYVTVQGLIRPGLTVTEVHATWLAGSAFGPGAVEVSYVLTNSGNVRFGVEPSVSGRGLFGLSSRTVDGTKIDDLLPHASVRQTVTLDDVWPTGIENVLVSATAVSALGRDDPGIGTVTASAWEWLWSGLYVLVAVAVAALAGWLVQRRRVRRPGTFGPPPGLWGDAPAPDAPASASGTAQ